MSVRRAANLFSFAQTYLKAGLTARRIAHGCDVIAANMPSIEFNLVGVFPNRMFPVLVGSQGGPYDLRMPGISQFFQGKP